MVFIGTILALSIHFLKMFIRLIGEGCLTQLITVGEVMTVCVSVLASIFVRQFAIFAASFLFIGAFYNEKKRYEKRETEEKREELIDESTNVGSVFGAEGMPVANTYSQVYGDGRRKKGKKGKKSGKARGFDMSYGQNMWDAENMLPSVKQGIED